MVLSSSNSSPLPKQQGQQEDNDRENKKANGSLLSITLFLREQSDSSSYSNHYNLMAGFELKADQEGIIVAVKCPKIQCLQI